MCAQDLDYEQLFKTYQKNLIKAAEIQWDVLYRVMTNQGDMLERYLQMGRETVILNEASGKFPLEEGNAPLEGKEKSEL